MATIADHLGTARGRRIAVIADAPELSGIARLGFEVELEGGTGRWPEVPGWVIKDDGSLRGERAEYIFDGPTGGAAAVNAIKAFHAAMAEYKPEPTFRCSTHCHMDMRTADWNIYEKTVLAYMVFEDLFFDHCEDYRRNSNFCVPFMNNDWFSAYFGRKVIAQDEAHKFHHVATWSKYSALNLQTTASFGSIEFRGSHALVDEDELLGLANRMLSLRLIAERYKDMSHLDMVATLSGINPQEVFVGNAIAADYVMDPGGREQGTAAALNAITQAELVGDTAAQEREVRRQEQERQVFRAEQDRARRLRDEVRRVVGGRISYNTDQLRHLNIQAPLHASTWAGAFATVTALAGVGVNVRVRDVLGTNVDRVNAHLDWFRDRIEELNRQGWTVTLDQLA